MRRVLPSNDGESERDGGELTLQGWECGRSPLTEFIAGQTERCLEVYARDSNRLLEDANSERRIFSLGYHDRQLEELLQNAVDAARRNGSRVEVLLTSQALYVANDGEPFDHKGLESIMATDISNKGTNRIGRFGIGFKSLLAISDTPKVLSRSVSFGFDRNWSEGVLRHAGYETTHYPVMRLARLLDPEAESQSDRHLSDMMSWASTVVVVPLKITHDELSRRLDEFPSEFILFSPHIHSARLRNLTSTKPDADREIRTVREPNGILILHAGAQTSTWKVVEEVHRPGPTALDDGGYAAARQQISVGYAVTIPPSTADGRFWAYFPTRDTTTLTGLLNAPWKLSEDRIHMQPGAFNEEILRHVVPRLVGRALPTLGACADPATVLDVMPARGRETRGWADRTLNSPNDSPVFDHLRKVPSLPDGTGTLQRPGLLRWAGELPQSWYEAWHAIPSAPRHRWVHPGANLNRERRLKVRRLLGTAGTENEGNAGIGEWLEAVIESEGTVASSASAIRLAAMITEDLPRIMDPEITRRAREGLARARIIRLENGEFKPAVKGRVFVRLEGDDRDHVDFVDPQLAAIPDVKDDLRRLGVVVMDRSGELHALLARAQRADGTRNLDAVWPLIWQLLRDVPEETGLRILREDLGPDLEQVVRVRTATGAWVTPGEAFIGGTIVPVDGSRDRDRLIDPAFHRQDARMLHEVGAVEAPIVRFDMPREPWMDAYEEDIKDYFVEKQSHGQRPDRNKVTVRGSAPAWPLQPLVGMSGEARVAATQHLLAQGLPSSWTVQHVTQPQYGKYSVVAPEIWFIRKHGLLPTAFGNLRPRRVLQASDVHDPRILPAFEASDPVARALGLLPNVDEMYAEDWDALKAVADGWVGSDEDDARRTEFYSWLTDRITPDSLVVRVGARRQAVALENIGVTDDPGVYDSMLEGHIPALFTTIGEDFDRFRDPEHWGLTLGSELLQEEIVAEVSGDAEYLTDLFPPMKIRLALEEQDIRIQPCTRLVKMLATPQGQIARPIQYRRDAELIYVTGSEPAQRLRQAADALDLHLDAADIAKIFDEMAQRAANQRTRAIQAAPDDDERLLLAVGVDALRRIVPSQALAALESAPGGLDDRGVAALARAVHGVGILKQLRAALSEAGLEPPQEWAGRRRTRQWVTSLGFPADWAGFSSSERPAVEIVDGPVELGTLHDYQVHVTHQITALLQGTGSDRGMVSLPTGAGKTRVTVQALIDGVRDGDIDANVPLIWIAQTDELCEQAAETWASVWRVRGKRMPMRLGRLWASRDVDEEPGNFQLIVATIDKLRSIASKEDNAYDWLRNPSVVVIDEAHTSIATSYTGVLEWLGRSGRGRNTAIRRPLIGLTATPFRGKSEFETDRLVNRYDGNRLDRGAFRNDDDPYGELQEMGVLAQVQHELIDGTDIELSAEELARMEEFGGVRLPQAVEARLGERLDRTLRVADHIASQPEDWTMLAFTPSVESARVLAALLSYRGVSAVSVSAETDSAARRFYVEEFKAGRIRVITNYNVLTQGFDAPKVRAVYVARPTFSPNVYQQMIGRGLRGPRNGGLDEVLIVNVDDNFANYGERLAFTEFEYLWMRR